MINGNAPKIERPVAATWRTARNPDPSLHGFGHSGSRRAATRSRELLGQFVSNAAHLPWIGRQQVVAHGLGTAHCQESAIGRRDRGKER